MYRFLDDMYAVELFNLNIRVSAQDLVFFLLTYMEDHICHEHFSSEVNWFL